MANTEQNVETHTNTEHAYSEVSATRCDPLKSVHGVMTSVPHYLDISPVVLNTVPKDSSNQITSMSVPLSQMHNNTESLSDDKNILTSLLQRLSDSFSKQDLEHIERACLENIPVTQVDRVKTIETVLSTSIDNIQTLKPCTKSSENISNNSTPTSLAIPIPYMPPTDVNLISSHSQVKLFANQNSEVIAMGVPLPNLPSGLGGEILAPHNSVIAKLKSNTVLGSGEAPLVAGGSSNASHVFVKSGEISHSRDTMGFGGNISANLLDKVRAGLVSDVSSSPSVIFQTNPSTTKISDNVHITNNCAGSLSVSTSVTQVGLSVTTAVTPVITVSSASHVNQVSLPSYSHSNYSGSAIGATGVTAFEIVQPTNAATFLPTLPSYTDSHQLLDPTSHTIMVSQNPEPQKLTNLALVHNKEQPKDHSVNVAGNQEGRSAIEYFVESATTDVCDPVAINIIKEGQGDFCEVIELVTDSQMAKLSGTYCVECNKTYPSDCEEHKTTYHHIVDRPILSRARNTLPDCLSLKETSEHAKIFPGVIAKEQIPAKTMFGPLEGQVLSYNQEEHGNLKPTEVWRVFQGTNPAILIDSRLEEHANWLMFMRRAKMNKDQNVIVFQKGLSLYFVTTQAVEPTAELRYWYSKEYSAKLNMPSEPDDFGKCSVCGKQFLDDEALSRHNKQVHSSQQNRKYGCSICEKRFSSRTKVDLHMTSHTGARLAKCSICNKGFTDKSNLAKHMKIHQAVKEHTCSQCGKSFRQRAHLDSHQMTHVEKWLACPVCDKKFARASDLEGHSNMHTKERVFPCPVCSKVFYRKSILKQHQQLHNSSRPKHTCTQCSKDFPDKYHLKRHAKSCKGKKVTLAQIRSETGAELGLSIAKKRIQKRDSQLAQGGVK